MRKQGEQKPRGDVSALAGKLASKLEAALARQGRRRFCWLPVFLALGSALYFTLRYEPDRAEFLTLALVLGGLILFQAAGRTGLLQRWRNHRLYVRFPGSALPVLKRCLAGAVMAGLGGFLLAAWQAHRQPPMPDLPHEAVWLEGRLTEAVTLPPRQKGQQARLRLTLAQVVFDSPWYFNDAPLSRQLRVTVQPRQFPGLVSPEGKLSSPATQIGRQLRLRALLHPPSPPFMPGGRDPQREAWFSGLAGSGTGYGAVEFPEGARGQRKLQALAWTLEKLRLSWAQRIMTVLPGPDGAVAATLLVGETGGISPTLRQEFAASGLAHILAVAGLHLGMVMVVCAWACRRLFTFFEGPALRWPCRDLSLCAALLSGAVYVGLTGAHLPGVRALGMAALAVLGLLAGRKAVSMRSLALVALALLVISPVLVLDVSFQMSFAAVMALIAGYERWAESLHRLRGLSLWHRLGSATLGLGLTSLLAGGATLPITMAHFGRLQPWFIVANLIAVPLMGLWVMPLGVLCLVLMPFSGLVPLADLALVPMGWGIAVIRALAHGVAALPAASVPTGTFSGGVVACCLLGLCLVCLWQGRIRWLGVPLIAAGLALGLTTPRPVLIVAPDGRFIAVRDTAKQAFGAGPGRNEALRASWGEETGFDTAATLPTDCRQEGSCILPLAGRPTQLVHLRLKARGQTTTTPNESPEPEMCREVLLAVSLVPARRPCPGVPYLTRLSTRRDGAWAVYATGMSGTAAGAADEKRVKKTVLRLVSDRSWRGNRPWVGPPGFEGVPGLPLARAE
ncbi:ComEC/Rec2 family competence protein [Oecophyllibacter saccharovorans]|uniref:ComEC family competence protein n=1 Tax=Oecophyllibacter saccharovorans TaxID=2558360 RepID=A0A506UM78_9PROT|nr:ComEC/Rec2 family competence protein [Oecophyllibacter saccharovorans]TPW34283.1 ComEC family competence protein [Oecophyllibacter saccharovorans]